MENIRLFFSAGKGRGLNDTNNRLREDVLMMLQHPPEEYVLDPEYGQDWRTMSTKWTTFLQTLTNVEYDTIEVKKIANLKSYDLEIHYKKENQTVHCVLGEFKHNIKSISKLPQYYSAPEKKGYIPVRYAEFFYDNYLDKICEIINLPKIEKELYMKHIYQPNYLVHPFFQALKDSEGLYYKQKQFYVRQSIQEYLEKYANDFSLEMFANDISSQQKKTFILWDCQEFHADMIHPEELQLDKIEKIQNKNTIVIVSKAGTKHKLLLRWRNHLGVLYPAWQISLER